MTVSTQANKAQFNGAGTTGPFTFNFRFFNNSEIFAIKTSTTGVDTDLSETVNYTLTGSGSYSGGSLTLVSSLAVGEKLTVYRVLPLTQATDLRNQGAFFAEVHEDSFDKLTMQVQQVNEAIGRAVQVPITSDVSPDDYLTEIEAIKDEAETAQAGAEAAQAATEAVLDEFTDIYLGVKASDPTTDNDGNALQEGALYWSSTAHRMRVYETGAWTDVTVSSSFTVDTFSGTGAQTAFTLSANPGTKNNTVVTISGVYQQKATYSVSGTTLTFTTAPPSGTSNIEVCIASTVSLNIPADDSVTTAALQDSSVTNAKLAFDGGAFGFRNKIIGGDFTTNPWQRGINFTAPVYASYLADRWVIYNSSDAVVNCNKVQDAPTAIQTGGTTTHHCLSLDVTTADTSIDSAQFCILTQHIEGFNAASFGFGQAGTRYVTLSFWHKHTKTGTYSVGIRNASNNRFYAKDYTQSVSDTWEQSILVFPVDTTGTWAIDNSIGLRLFFPLAVGSGYRAAPDTWQSLDYLGSTNQVNALDSTSNYFKLALIQLEAGSVATPFEARPVGLELALCQRYAEKSYELSVAKGTSTLIGAIQFIGSTTGAYQPVTYKTRKRNTAAQVMYIYGSTGVQNTIRNISSSSDLTATAGNMSETGFTMQNTGASANAVYAFHYFVEDEL